MLSTPEIFVAAHCFCVNQGKCAFFLCIENLSVFHFHNCANLRIPRKLDICLAG
nr:MAG TPA: hypothetical protein [Caudoviricetes sp.]